MWEVSFWLNDVQTGETFVSNTLDDHIKFIEGILWGLRNVAKAEKVEARVIYKEY